jgi:hypothetical protein
VTKALFKAVSSKWIGWILLFIILAASSFQSYRFITMFKFVDEYNNWVPAALMHQGKILYTNIFFNRMPLPAYISYVLQFLISPQADYYRVIQLHRVFMIIFSASWIGLIYWQFRKSWVLIFAHMFELLKPYFFGFSFQAEAMVVYPLVYLFILSISPSNWARSTLLFSGVCMWFVIFSRETTIITTFIIFVALCIRIRDYRKIALLATPFLILSFCTLASMDLGQWFFQMITVNKISFKSDISKASGITGLLGSFFLPFQYIATTFSTGASSFQRTIGLQVIFLIVMIYKYISKKIVKWPHSVLLVVYLSLLLFTSSLRSQTPEKELWAIYRLIPWIGILLSTLAYLVDEYKSKYRVVFIVLCLVFVASYYLHPNSLLLKQINRENEYNISYFVDIFYAHAIEQSTVADDNVFVIGYDSHIYLLAHRKTAYPYIFFYPVQALIPVYLNSVRNMFRGNSPVIVYTTDCEFVGEVIIKSIGIEKMYTRLLKSNKPSCLYVRNDRLAKTLITLKSSGFSK